jgi:hypothetical protein
MIYRKAVKCDVFKFQITCHKHNLKPTLADYIYPISYKIAKKGKPGEIDLPYLKTISQIFYQLQNSRYIAVTCNSALRTGMDDITGFLSL